MVLDKFSLKDKVAVVTGAAGLLGQKHVEALLEAGARVAALDVNQDRLNQLKEKSKDGILIFKTDITSREQVEKNHTEIEKTWGRSPDILINNATIDPKFDKSAKGGNPQRLENFNIEQWNLEISVGLTGALICTQVFGPAMAKRKQGAILNVASDLGIIAPDQRIYRKEGLAPEEQPVKPVTYSVIKHGLIGFTKYLASYWADQGVRCNALAPGGVFNSHPDEFVQKLTNLIPMRRMAHIDEYQAAVVFLVSDASSYMTGTTVVIDGGRTVW